MLIGISLYVTLSGPRLYAAAQPSPECGEWAVERDSVDNADLDLVDQVISEDAERCSGIFRLRGNASDVGDSLVPLELSLGLQNATLEWVPPANPSGHVFLAAPFESEIRLAPNDGSASAFVVIGAGLTPASFAVGLNIFLLKTALDTAPSAPCSISERQVSLVASRLESTMPLPTDLITRGDIPNARAELLRALPAFYKGAASALGDLGLSCAEEYFKLVALHPELLAKVGAAFLAWVPLATFDIFARAERNDEVRLIYTPAQASLLYRVTGVRDDDVLNVRDGPGVGNSIVGTIPADGTGVQVTGPILFVGPSRWVPVVYQGTVGWVNFRLLEPEE
jgi:hypothetical protein